MTAECLDKFATHGLYQQKSLVGGTTSLALTHARGKRGRPAHNQLMNYLLSLTNMAQFIQDIRSVPHPSPVIPDNVIVQRGFRITTRKLPILKAGPIEFMTANLGITPPEMIFGDNVVSVEHLESGWVIEFNSFDALNRVDKTGESMLQVAHSKEWQSTRYEEFTELEITAHAEKS